MLRLLNATMAPIYQAAPLTLSLVLGLWPCKGQSISYHSCVWQRFIGRKCWSRGTGGIHLEPGKIHTLSTSLCGFTMGPLAFALTKDAVLAAFLLLR